MRILFASLVVLCFITSTKGQNPISLPVSTQSSVIWEGEEHQYYSDMWETEVVTNVSTPEMQVFLPPAAIANGTSVIVAPGGGLYALSIENEGNEVARWLNKKGITAFVLKYRLLPTGKDGVAEGMAMGEAIVKKVAPILPLSIEDGLNAVSYVRQNADKWNLDPQRIGFMGFSAGGAVTMGVGTQAGDENKANFLVPVYPWTTVMAEYEVPEKAPPLFVICATDDPLILAPGSIELYSNWIQKGITAELHLYAKGGHGFGMEAQGLPSDAWISQFYEWAVSQGLINNEVAK